MFTWIPASPSCCWTIWAMSFAYTGSVVWVRIVRLTGPDAGLLEELTRLADVTPVERVVAHRDRVLRERRREGAGGVAAAEGDRVDDLLPVDRVRDRLAHLRVVEGLPLRVEEQEVVVEARLGADGHARLAAERLGDPGVGDERHVGGLRAERGDQTGLVGHDVDPHAVEVGLPRDVELA